MGRQSVHSESDCASNFVYILASHGIRKEQSKNTNLDSGSEKPPHSIRKEQFEKH